MSNEKPECVPQVLYLRNAGTKLSFSGELGEYNSYVEHQRYIFYSYCTFVYA